MKKSSWHLLNPSEILAHEKHSTNINSSLFFLASSATLSFFLTNDLQVYCQNMFSWWNRLNSEYQGSSLMRRRPKNESVEHVEEKTGHSWFHKSIGLWRDFRSRLSQIAPQHINPFHDSSSWWSFAFGFKSELSLFSIIGNSVYIWRRGSKNFPTVY